MTKWQSIKTLDHNPNGEDLMYIFYGPEEGVFIGRPIEIDEEDRKEGDGKYWISYAYEEDEELFEGDPQGEITHWMRLPDPPEE